MLLNGVEYKFKVTNYNINNEVAVSDWVIFTCRARPIASITNVANVTWSSLVGTTASGDTLTKTGGVDGSWDAGAVSAQSIATGDGYLEFIAYARDKELMCGLSYGSSNATYQDIDFAINLKNDGTVGIFEGGTDRGGFGTYIAGDIFKVAVEAQTIKYYKNGSLIYTSSVSPTYPLSADCSLLHSGAVIKSARMTGAKVLNSTYLFQGDYYQEQGIAIKSFSFNIYDENSNILESSGEIFSSTVEYEFENLNNGKDYFIELAVVSQDGLRHESGKILFTVEFETPYASLNVQSENQYDNASIKLTWEPLRITGVPSGTVSFVNGEKINVLNGSVTFLDELQWAGDFILKLWLEWSSIPDMTEILRIDGFLGYTSIWFKGGTFYVSKVLSGIPFAFKSNNIAPVDGNVVFVSINHVNNLMDIYAEVTL
jgi:hypothetical protein